MQNSGATRLLAERGTPGFCMRSGSEGPLTDDIEDFRKEIRDVLNMQNQQKTCDQGEKFESDIDMSLSNSSIGADAPAAAFGKTTFVDFASARHKV